MRFSDCYAVIATIALVAAGTACSANQTATHECPPLQGDFTVSNEIHLNTRIGSNLAVDSERRKAYVPYEERDRHGGVLIVDLDKHEIQKDVAFSEGYGGTVALDPKSHLLYAAEGSNDMSVINVINAETGDRVRSFAAQDTIFRMALDPDRGVLYLGGDEMLWAVEPEKGDILAAIDLAAIDLDLLYDVAVDARNSLVYAATSGGVAIIDASQNVVTAIAKVKGSDRLVADSEHHSVYTSSGYHGVVSAIDGKTGKVTGEFGDFNTPGGIGVCGEVLFVAEGDPGELVVANANTGQIAKSFAIGFHPTAMAFDENTGDLWVLSRADTAETTPGLLSRVSAKG